MRIFEGYCGKSDWKKDETVDVLNKVCLDRNIKNGEVAFDVYRLSSQNTHLGFGKGNLWMNKTDAGARPDKVDESNEFNKE